jgi:hypothetical protein
MHPCENKAQILDKAQGLAIKQTNERKQDRNLSRRTFLVLVTKGTRFVQLLP